MFRETRVAVGLMLSVFALCATSAAVGQTPGDENPANQGQGEEIFIEDVGITVNLTGQELRAVLEFVNEANVCELDRAPATSSSGAQRIIDFRPYESVEQIISLPNLVGARKALVLVAYTSSLGARSWVFDAELGSVSGCATEPEDGPGCAVLWQHSGTWDLCITRAEETLLLDMFNHASGYFLDEVVRLSEPSVADILASRPFTGVEAIGAIYQFSEWDAAQSLGLLRSYPRLD